MKKIYLRRTAKIIAFILCFAIVFFALNVVFSNLYISRTPIKSFYHLEKNSADAVFFGPSQMMRGVNSIKITDEYGIPSFSFGGNSQPLEMSYYYLIETLKRQKPKVVGVEISKIFDAKITPERVISSYSEMPLNAEKYNSLIEVFDGDKLKAAKTCVPLIANHSWWNQMNLLQIVGDLLSDHSEEYKRRGFYISYEAEPQKIEFLNGGVRRNS